MAEKKEHIKEVMVYNAPSLPIAEMLVDKLSGIGIPARIGSESTLSVTYGFTKGGTTILVSEKFAERARQVLASKK